MLRRLSKVAAPLVLGAFLALSLGSGQFASASEPGAPVVTGWTTIKFVQTQPACTGAGFPGAVHYQRLECGFGYAAVSGTTLTGALASVVKVGFIDADGNTLQTQIATARTTAGSQGWEFDIQPQRLPTPWPAGPITIRVTDVDPDGAGPQPNQTGNFGETGIILNALGGKVAPVAGNHAPGEAIEVNGEVYEIEHVAVLTVPKQIAVPGTVHLQVRTPAGEVRGPYGPFTADTNGHFHGTLPAAATAGPDRDRGDRLQDDPGDRGHRRVLRRPRHRPLGQRLCGLGLAAALHAGGHAAAREQLRVGRRLGEARRDVSVPRLRAQLHGEPRERRGREHSRSGRRDVHARHDGDRQRRGDHLRRHDQLGRRQRPRGGRGRHARAEDARRRGEGRHDRPGPADRLEEPLVDRDARRTRAARR